jgi:hypothetical protein
VSGAVVICVDSESYVSAIVALDELAKQLEDGSVTKLRLQSARQDFERAHAMYQAVDARITTPALLRRQAG